eukprot:TRINITY_DN17378_c0_g1_i4.p1 TRINITY_DN17378_c0_g1~~TRINITY_DN17378_c0_g1_i4.p1  ORF type:complete len:116 (-),score=17.51 TRINITY_DN17378_c0_g1_i4:79-426(-)
MIEDGSPQPSSPMGGDKSAKLYEVLDSLQELLKSGEVKLAMEMLEVLRGAAAPEAEFEGLHSEVWLVKRKAIFEQMWAWNVSSAGSSRQQSLAEPEALDHDSQWHKSDPITLASD